LRALDRIGNFAKPVFGKQPDIRAYCSKALGTLTNLLSALFCADV
jgi:hypothetical protein